MTNWILILYAATNAMSSTDSVALTNIPYFETQQECQKAGNLAQDMANGTYKTIKFVCVKATKT